MIISMRKMEDKFLDLKQTLCDQNQHEAVY